MFWGDRDPVRGASSLRNALSVLKKDLAELGDELITSDAQDVRLNIDRLWIDVVHYATPEGREQLRQTHGQRLPDLIEGLNVRASGDDTFEDWLRVERQHWIDDLEPHLEQPQERERIDPPLRGPVHAAIQDMQSHFGIASDEVDCRVNRSGTGGSCAVRDAEVPDDVTMKFTMTAQSMMILRSVSRPKELKNTL